MQPVTLLLATPAGDELGRLALAEVEVAGAGETGGALRPRLAADLVTFYDKIAAAVAEEGMELALDSIDCQIAVSRALLAAGDDAGEILIRLPVRDGRNAKDIPSSVDRPGEPRDILDDLFDLSDLNGGGSTRA